MSKRMRKFLADVIEALGEQSFKSLLSHIQTNTMTIGTLLRSGFQCIYHQWPNKRCSQSADVIVGANYCQTIFDARATVKQRFT